MRLLDHGAFHCWNVPYRAECIAILYGTILQRPRGLAQLLCKTEHTYPRLLPVLHPEGIGGFRNFYGN